jgi:hypothetical protein
MTLTKESRLTKAVIAFFKWESQLEGKDQLNRGRKHSFWESFCSPPKKKFRPETLHQVSWNAFNRWVDNNRPYSDQILKNGASAVVTVNRGHPTTLTVKQEEELLALLQSFEYQFMVLTKEVSFLLIR